MLGVVTDQKYDRAWYGENTDQRGIMFKWTEFLMFLESRVCASTVLPVPCSALVFANKLLFKIEILNGQNARADTRVYFAEVVVLLPGCAAL
jgi:hypothetical protein